MTFKLPICNPSDYPRGGYVTVPLSRVNRFARQSGAEEVKPGRVTLRDERRNLLPAQVDEVLDEDASVLCFSLAEALKPGEDEHYTAATQFVTVEGAAAGAAGGGAAPVLDDKLGLDVVRLEGEARGVKLKNSRLELWFNLAPSLNQKEQKWYAGAATSVLLDGQEMLDPNPFYESHDWEKRCLQVDLIRLPCPAWDPAFELDVPMDGRPYEVVSESRGPVRVSFTAASPPFPYRYTDPLTGEAREMQCRLYRVISLYAGADHVAEELFVRGMPAGAAGGTKAHSLAFVARYFTYVNVMELCYSRFANIPDWFAVSSLRRPYLSYGFATDIHAGPVAKPHPAYPDWNKEEKCFSWELYPCTRARAVHLFMRYRPVERDLREGEEFSRYEAERREEAKRHFEHRTGKTWYEEVYKPLGLMLS